MNALINSVSAKRGNTITAKVIVIALNKINKCFDNVPKNDA